MNSFAELIARRRSVRAFDPCRKVDRPTLERIIRASAEAPSWKNLQASRYHIVDSPELVERLRGMLLGTNPEKVAGAPALVVCTFVKGVVGFAESGQPTNELGDGWGIYDLGLHNAYMLLAAADEGVDSLIMGMRDAQAIRQLLRIPEEEVVVDVIALGYRAHDVNHAPKKAVEELAKFY